MGLRLGALGMAGRNTATTSIVTRAMFEGLAAGLGRGVAGLVCKAKSANDTGLVPPGSESGHSRMRT
jgi:hypothetical protein